MTISSRTPEGDPNRCPVCGHALRLEPSRPPGDASCPSCGSLLWFPPPVAASPVTPAGRDSAESRAASIKPRDRVRVKHGTFAAVEGSVDAVLEPRGLLRVTITVFGRPLPVELEADQVELVS